MADLARRYVQALFDLSVEANELEENIHQAEELSIDLLGEDRMYYLQEPDVAAADKKEKLEQAYRDKLSVTMWSLLLQLLADNKMACLPDILPEFIRISKRRLGHIEARVKSAAILNQEEKNRIEALLEQKAGKPVNVSYSLTNLIAGFYILMKGKIFSARGKLNDLKRNIGRGERLVSDAGELSTVIKEQIRSFSQPTEFEDVGTVVVVGDGIAKIYGLDRVMNGELVQFSNGEFGMALNLEENVVGAVILGSDQGIKEGDPVKLTGRMAEVPAGDAMSGRVVNALGQAIDGEGDLIPDCYLPIERQAPTVIMRSEVNESLETGIKSIDALVPIGKGQRELIIGDRQTGKTAIAVDAILNQKGKNVRCVYVAIGQKSSTIARIQNRLRDKGAMDYTTIVFSSASDSSPLQYIAPYAGCTIAEYWMEKGENVLIVYDDLSKHAVAYRTISLLLGRPPGREAYPGDVFFLHSRLLERAAKMDAKHGGGSLTALPIVETQEGDISAYVPTNVISITDGQIFLEADLFNNGFRPAINPGLSVSRVGGSAQHPAMRKLAGPLRIEYAQYNELAAFAQFGSDLNPETQAQLNHGERIREVLKQPQYEPMDVSYQIMVLHALMQGAMQEVNVHQIDHFQRSLIRRERKQDPELHRDIRRAGALTDDLKERIDRLIEEVKDRDFPDRPRPVSAEEA